MSDDWDPKLVIGHKKTTPKVAKKDSDLNGQYLIRFYNAIANTHIAVRRHNS